MFKASIHKWVNRLGYKLERLAAPVDVRSSGNDPRQSRYPPGRSVLIDAPVASGRIRFFPLVADANPFVQAVAVAWNAPDPFDVIRTALERYYARVQPRDIYEWVGLNEADAPGLSAVPIWAIPEPWVAGSLAQKQAAMNRVAMNESQRHGQALSASHGDKGYGPVSADKLRTEARRLCEVLDSIRRTGYRRHDRADGDIEAQVFLREDGAWRWQVSRGLHRAAVLAAMGPEPIPVRVKALIDRRDAGIWPNVRSGLYTRCGAERYFDRIFDGTTVAAACAGGTEPS